MSKKNTFKVLGNYKIEMLSVNEQKQAFPDHYHDQYCFSYIQKGVEVLRISKLDHFAPEGRISLCHPGEVHSNPLAESSTPLSFETIYIPTDIVSNAFKENQPKFLHVQPFSDALIEAFNDLKLCLMGSANELEQVMISFLNRLKREEVHHKPIQLEDKWIDLTTTIDAHISEKFSLEYLSKKLHMDKFHFSKEFKRRFGMPPMNYVQMKKVFHIKENLERTSDLTDIGYQYHFSDQAHFSKTFKKYIGVSPKAYCKSL